MAKGMNLDEFRNALSSEATKENEQLKEEIEKLKAGQKKLRKKIDNLEKDKGLLLFKVRQLSNRCFVLTKGMMCQYCQLECVYGFTDDEYTAGTRYMIKNKLPRTDETKQKVWEYMDGLRRKRIEKMKREDNK